MDRNNSIDHLLDINAKFGKARWQCSLCCSNTCQHCFTSKVSSHYSSVTRNSDFIELNKSEILTPKTELIEEWTCTTCFIVNNQSQCTRCGDDKQILVTLWTCDTCTCVNESNHNICEHCGEIKRTTIMFNSLEIDEHFGSTNYVTMTNKGIDLMDHNDITVTQNDDLTRCSFCDITMLPSQGFLLRLCSHKVCDSCILQQIENKELKCLALVHNVPCGRSLELSEIKLVFTDSQYKRFVAHLVGLNETNSYIERCFNESCRGYHLKEKHQSRPNEFYCNTCELANCLQCGAIHDGVSCKQYNKLVNGGKFFDKDALELFFKLIREIKAEPCSKCESISK